MNEATPERLPSRADGPTIPSPPRPPTLPWPETDLQQRWGGADRIAVEAGAATGSPACAGVRTANASPPRAPMASSGCGTGPLWPHQPTNPERGP
jgi:hypothetical protein